MGPRRSVLPLAFVVFALLVPALRARAEDHKWAAFVAVSRTSTGAKSLPAGSLWNGGLAAAQQVDDERTGLGWHVAGEVTLDLPWGIGKKIAFVGDVSGHLIGDGAKTDATQLTVMVGPRIALFSPWKSHVFVHFMGFGAIHRADASLDRDASTMALAIGAGVDFTLFNDGHDGFRFQIDRIYALADQVDGSVRISLGYVHRF
jgi:hypothetical protein